MIKLVTYDYNGTILDDAEIMNICTTATIINYSSGGPYEKLRFECWRKEFDLPYDNFYEQFGLTINQAIHDEYHKIYNSFKMPRIFRNFKWSLAEIQKTGMKTAVISGTSNEKSFYQTIRRKKLKFDKIYLNCRDKISAFQQAAKDFNIQTNEIAYICDMKYDIRASRTAGAISIYHLNGFTGHWGLEEKPDYCFDNYRKLPRLIQRINQ